MDSGIISLVDYEKQKNLKLNDNDLTFIIVGCGGIGSWLAIALAMLGFSKLYLIDGDIVNETNLNRLPFDNSYIGKKKVLALHNYISNIRPSCNIFISDTHCNIDVLNFLMANVTDKTKILFDCTDDARIQKELHKFSNTYKTIYRKISYEGFTFAIYKDMNIWVSDDYEPGYAFTSSNILTSMVSACMGIYHVLNEIFFQRESGKDVTCSFKNIITQGENNVIGPRESVDL